MQTFSFRPSTIPGPEIMWALTISAQSNIRKIPLQTAVPRAVKKMQEKQQKKKLRHTRCRKSETHPSYCMVTVLPMSANLRSSKIKKLCLSAIFKRIKHTISNNLTITTIRLPNQLMTKLRTSELLLHKEHWCLTIQRQKANREYLCLQAYSFYQSLFCFFVFF